MALLNVRLSPADARLAAALREEGVPISALVREAIRSEHARRLGAPGRSMKPSSVVADILRRLPEPPDLGPRELDTTDRRAVKRHVRAKLERKRA